MAHARTDVSGLVTWLSLSILLTNSLAAVPLSSWQQGISTNYGGAADGMSPDQPSFGTKSVSP